MMKIKEIIKENRPMERMIKFGPEVLNNAELLAIILQTGIKNENVIDICNKVLKEFDCENSFLYIKEKQENNILNNNEKNNVYDQIAKKEKKLKKNEKQLKEIGIEETKQTIDNQQKQIIDNKQKIIMDNQKTINNQQNLNFSKCTLNGLQKIKGIGKVKACKILAMMEFIKRYKYKNNLKKIKNAKDVFDYFFQIIFDLKKEYFIVLLLDTKNKIIKHEIITIGILNCSLVHPREIFSSAIKESANSIILVHNHPSGDCLPSKEDIQITKILNESGKILSINVLDHVILSNTNYYSFKENTDIL